MPAFPDHRRVRRGMGHTGSIRKGLQRKKRFCRTEGMTGASPPQSDL
jgi:hypothetical protein